MLNINLDLDLKLNLLANDKHIYQANALDILGYTLYPEQTKWYSFCFEEGHQARMLLGARKYGKTQVVTLLGTLQYLAKNLNYNPKVMIITRSDRRTKGIIQAIESGIRQMGIGLSKANSLEIYLKSNKTNQPNVSGYTLQSRELRGNHVDVAILDDPVVPQDARSNVDRENTKHIFRECLNIASKVVVLGQPVHKDDLYALLKKGEAIQTRYSFYNENPIPELNTNINQLRQITTEAEIQKNYFNTLIDEELYPFSNLRIEEFDFTGNTIACIDPAFDGNDRIGVAIGIKTADNYKVIAVHVEGNIYDKTADILKLLKHFNVCKCYVESNDNGGALRYIKSQEPSFITLGYKETINKEVRILSRIGRVKEQLLIHPKSDIQDILDYNTDGQHDDVIDALASLLNFLTGNGDKVKVNRG